MHNHRLFTHSFCSFNSRDEDSDNWSLATEMTYVEEEPMRYPFRPPRPLRPAGLSLPPLPPLPPLSPLPPLPPLSPLPPLLPLSRLPRISRLPRTLPRFNSLPSQEQPPPSYQFFCCGISCIECNVPFELPSMTVSHLTELDVSFSNLGVGFHLVFNACGVRNVHSN